MTDLYDKPLTTEEKNYLAELVGEGKKFKTPEDLAKGKYEADLYIKDIIRQKDELRDDYLKLREESQARATLKELVDQLSNPARPESSTTQANTAKPAIDQAAIDEIFGKKLKEHELSKTRENNAKMVADALKERYGQNYVEALNKQTEELGLTKEDVNYLAQSMPKALIKTLGLDKPPTTESYQAPPKTSSLFSPTGQQKRTWSYYQNMKKDQPNLYLSPKMQVQMHKDYESMGRDFEDGDFLTMGQSSAF